MSDEKKTIVDGSRTTSPSNMTILLPKYVDAEAHLLMQQERATAKMLVHTIEAFLEENIQAGELGILVAKFIAGESLSVRDSTVLQLEAAVKQRAVEPRPDERPPANPTRYRGNVIVNKDSGGGMPAPGQFKNKKGEG